MMLRLIIVTVCVRHRTIKVYFTLQFSELHVCIYLKFVLTVEWSDADDSVYYFALNLSDYLSRLEIFSLKTDTYTATFETETIPETLSFETKTRPRLWPRCLRRDPEYIIKICYCYSCCQLCVIVDETRSALNITESGDYLMSGRLHW